MLYRFFVLLTTICLHQFTLAQPASTISGNVVSIEGEALAYAQVFLSCPKDSSLRLAQHTDEKGYFSFKGLSQNNYQIKVNYLGSPGYQSGLLALGSNANLKLTEIQLSQTITELNEVEIIGRRSNIVLRPDKIIVNVVGNLSATSSNALDLLRKSPGVIVNSNDAIRLNGTQGVLIYIDGKPSPLRGRDLANFLRSLQASEIDHIEIITNPSAKYDAEGSGGIINLVLKKDKSHGGNLSASLSYSTGKKPWYNGSLSSNFRSKKYNLFGSYGFNSGVSVSQSQILRQQKDFTLDQTNQVLSQWIGHNLKAGLDIFLTKNSTFGVQLKQFYTNYDWTNYSRSPLYHEQSFAIDSVLIAQYDIDGQRDNLNLNASYRYQGEGGSALNIDADYGNYKNPAQVYQPNAYLDPEEQSTLSRRLFESDRDTYIKLRSLKADYEQPIGKGQFAAGVKIAQTQTHNRFDFFDITSIRMLDVNRSQEFDYSEQIAAAYSNYQISTRNLTVKAGLRVENTRSTGILEAYKTVENERVERQYLDFFPSGGLSLELNPKNSFQLNYSRRINRPSFNHLNPFNNQLDEFSYEEGNPYLSPEYTHKIQLTHGFNYQIYTSLSFSQTNNLIIRMREVADAASNIFRLRNLASQQNFSLNTSISHQLTKWWYSYHNLMVYHVHNVADFGPNKVIDIRATSFYLYAQHAFSLPHHISVELYGWYNSPKIMGGNSESSAIWSVDAGIRKKLWDERISFSASVSDIFFSNRWKSVSTFDGIEIISSGHWDSRRVNVGISFFLGKKTVKKLKIKDGLEEESNRLDREQEKKKW